MPAISASAPGKAILFGEHAVVYGQPAIAVPVTQVRAKVIVQARPDFPAGRVLLQAPEIGLENILANLPSDDPLASGVKSVFDELGITQPPAMTIRITSTIPVASGLGSGAAVSVAIIRALAEFLGRPLTDVRVSALAYEIEKIHHGTPSGIDNTVVTYAVPVFFRKIGGGEPDHVETLKVSKPFTLVVCDSGIPSPTITTVSDVRQAWQDDQQHFNSLFESVGLIVEQAKRAIEAGKIDRLGPLMDHNQQLLAEMHVSSDELERLIQVARQAGASGAKLSGGGRGGNIIALVEPESAERVSLALSSAGAVNTIVTEINSQFAKN
jgi:mevalonate kinase